jgi:hypothetical protein
MTGKILISANDGVQRNLGETSRRFSVVRHPISSPAGTSAKSSM